MNQDLIDARDKLIRRKKMQARIQRHWASVVVGILFIYVSLPVLAPTLMKLGATGPGNALYTLYSPLCHQFAFRSIFLYGEQTFYPRETVGAEGLESFDERAAESPVFIDIYEDEKRKILEDNFGEENASGYSFRSEQELAQWDNALTLAARRFRGDDEMGYKTALCARDMAIYAMMVVGGILFIPIRKQLRPAPIWLYVLLGLMPIAIDGFSQLFSYPPFEFWAARESPPELRVLTGATFGFMNVWLAFPYIEQSMKDSSEEIEATIAAIEVEDNRTR